MTRAAGSGAGFERLAEEKETGGCESFRCSQRSRQQREWVQVQGGLKRVSFVPGLSDNYVELTSGDLKLGDMVVADELHASGTSGATSSSSLRFPR